jgi:hypothetical protein
MSIIGELPFRVNTVRCEHRADKSIVLDSILQIGLESRDPERDGDRFGSYPAEKTWRTIVPPVRTIVFSQQNGGSS